MKQGDWRKFLKFTAVTQTITAIASAIAAIHQLLKKQLTGKGASLAGGVLLLFILRHKRAEK